MNKAPMFRQITKYVSKNLGKFANFLKETRYSKMSKGLEPMTMSFAYDNGLCFLLSRTQHLRKQTKGCQDSKGDMPDDFQTIG